MPGRAAQGKRRAAGHPQRVIRGVPGHVVHPPASSLAAFAREVPTLAASTTGARWAQRTTALTAAALAFGLPQPSPAGDDDSPFSATSLPPLAAAADEEAPATDTAAPARTAQDGKTEEGSSSPGIEQPSAKDLVP